LKYPDIYREKQKRFSRDEGEIMANDENMNETQIVPIEEMNLEDFQLADQLYNSAGLDPVVNAGLKDYDEQIQQENKLITKVLGPRASDIKGYGEAVARRVAFAVYSLLNRQYGGKVGDLRSHIMALQDERDRANTRYDDLMGRVVGILGEEYKELRSDSKQFMEKLTNILGEDLKDSKIDQQALAEKLADIDGLRNQIVSLTKENEEQKRTSELRLEEQKKIYEQQLEKQKISYETQLEKQENKYETKAEKQNEKHEKEIMELKAQITGFQSDIKELEAKNQALTTELAGLKDDYARLQAAVDKLQDTVSLEELGEKLGAELHEFILQDSKVPDMVIDGVGKFIDFKKYLGMAAVRGAETALGNIEKTMREAMKK
jgi:DNA repair exonuclease SbcCD ATPase subunit